MNRGERLHGIARVDSLAPGRAHCRLLEPTPWPRVVTVGDRVLRAPRSGETLVLPSLRGSVLEVRKDGAEIVTDIGAEACGIRWRKGWTLVLWREVSYLGDAIVIGEEHSRLLLRLIIPVEGRPLRPGDNVATFLPDQ